MPGMPDSPAPPPPALEPRSTRALPSDRTAEPRSRSLANLGILDSDPEPEFDDLVRLASTICGAPIALVSLLDRDRQWFKARVGLAATQTPINQSFCAYAIDTPDRIMIVEDATADERFRENPLVTEAPNIRAYAGMPVLDALGTPLGTVCVIDTTPREFSDAEREALRVIARQIGTQLELRVRVRQLEQLGRSLTASNEQLDQFAHIISHDLMSPIRQQTILAQMLTAKLPAGAPEAIREYSEHIRLAGRRAIDLIADLDAYVEAARQGRSVVHEVQLRSVIDKAVAATDWPSTTTVTTGGDLDETVEVNRAALYHILLNLLSNAAKFADPAAGQVRVVVTPGFDTVAIEVGDNGAGMSDRDMGSVFELFRRGANADGKPGRGMGLSIARRLALELCGELTVRRTAAAETVFRIELPRAAYYGVGARWGSG